MRRDVDYRIVYVGCGLSGRWTSLVHVLTTSGIPKSEIDLLSSSPHETSCPHDGRALGLSLSVSTVRARLYYEDPEALRSWRAWRRSARESARRWTCCSSRSCVAGTRIARDSHPSPDIDVMTVGLSGILSYSERSP